MNSFRYQPLDSTTSRRRSGCAQRSDRGLTLIELLVVIVILVTLVAGVVPILSPNNDARKIREASRQLAAMVSQAQATAARTNRPAGIAFSGLDPADGQPRGVALEAYFVAQPPVFRGFDQDSAVVLNPIGANRVELTFGRGVGQQFLNPPQPAGFQTSDVDSSNWLPPRMVRPGDQVVVAGNRFELVASPHNQVETVTVQDVHGNQSQQLFLLPAQTLIARWIGWDSRQERALPAGGHRYEVIRQATSTSDQPVQFPSGIGIDTTASENFGTYNTVSILFHPSGQVEGIYQNGVKNTRRMSWIDILIGRAENAKQVPVQLANTTSTPVYPIDYEFPTDYEENPSGDWPGTQWEEFDFSGDVTDDQLERAREEINWLNSDSQWVRIGVQSGRVIVAENGFFDPRIDIDTSLSPYEQFRVQISDSGPTREFVQDMIRTGGG